MIQLKISYRALSGAAIFGFAVACGPSGSIDDGETDGQGTGSTSNGGGSNNSGGSSQQGSGGANQVTGGGGNTDPESESCTNVRPTGSDWDEATCDQWASETSECDEDWMIDNDYCNESCGRCTDSETATGGGSNGSGGTVSLDKFVGNITTHDEVDTQGLTFSTYWDQITPENAGKWGSIQFTAGASYNWSTLDSIYDYAQDSGIVFKEHTFVWGNQQPGGNIGEAEVRDWMQAFCSRYPETKMIDVVNEPPPHTEPAYSGAIGGGTNGDWQWITNSFLWAREACPNAILLINDYNNIEWDGDNQHFIDIVNTVLENGAPIDAIGAQSHDLDHDQVTPQKAQRLLAKLHDDTGLDIFITEFDISTTDDNEQLAIYQEYIPYFMETEYIKGITIWGWIYGSTWDQAPNSGLVNNGNPRPAMTWLMETLGRPSP